ncbi:putative Zn-ribbon and HTH transcriptional regulator [Bacillus fengqiuensis]|nr:putative Zn-ribbon and HTH transcriptional regulator [Bacillus fengqiuensis]
MSTKMETKRTAPNYLEFYKNLPPKSCVNCGYIMIEQHESYSTKCEHCLSKGHE